MSVLLPELPKTGFLLKQPLDFLDKPAALLLLCATHRTKPNAPLSDGFRAHRGIMLSGIIGKVLHKTYRQGVSKPYNDFMRDNACGGVAHRGVDFATHIVRTKQSYYRAKGVSSGVVFVDLKSAFDMMSRMIAMLAPDAAVNGVKAAP